MLWLRLTGDLGRAIHSIASFDGRAVGFREPFAQAEQRRRQCDSDLFLVPPTAWHRPLEVSPHMSAHGSGAKGMFQEAGRGRGWVVTADAHVEEYNGL